MAGNFALDHDFFQAGNSQLAETASIQSKPEESEMQKVDHGFINLEPMASFKCQACGIALLTQHLLDMHLREVHDPFFEAQVAKRLKVFVCLVEDCSQAFCSIMDRKKHLVDYHEYPTNYAFDRLHLGKKQAQKRPDEQFQKPKPEKFRQKSDRAPPNFTQGRMAVPNAFTGNKAATHQKPRLVTGRIFQNTAVPDSRPNDIPHEEMMQVEVEKPVRKKAAMHDPNHDPMEVDSLSDVFSHLKVKSKFQPQSRAHRASQVQL